MAIETTTQSKMKKGRIWIIARFIEANTGKNGLIKYITLFAIAAIVGVSSFVMRGEILYADLSNTTDFIHVTTPLFNTGVAWSGLASADPSVVIFLQFFPVLIGLLILVWLKRWWTVLPVALFVFGGACNFADRFINETYNGVTYTNAVVDYLQFDGRTEKFNLPDAFIIIGAGLAVIAVIVSTLIGLFRRTPSPQATVNQQAVATQAAGSK